MSPNSSLQEVIHSANEKGLQESVKWLASFVGSMKEMPGVPVAIQVMAAWSMVILYHTLEGRLTAEEASQEEKKAAFSSDSMAEVALAMKDTLARLDLQREVESGLGEKQ